MRIEVLATGDELLDGRVVDTNTARLADALVPWGLEIAQRTTVRDREADIVREARAVIARGTKLCVVSGGLGTTSDDLTREAFANLAQVSLIRDQQVLAQIKERLTKRGYPLLDSLAKQADRPAGAEIIDNPVGSAPGFALSVNGCCFVSLPGVPREFEAMMTAGVLDRLTLPKQPLVRRLFKCLGNSEAAIGESLAPLVDLAPLIRVGYRAAFPEVHVTLIATQDQSEMLLKAANFVRQALGYYVFSESSDTIATVVINALKNQSATVSTAESCTSGLIADTLTDVSGASEVFIGGVSAYANSVKVEILDVPQAILDEHGAVSEPTVAAMAKGAQKHLKSTYALATSGILGPSGGSAEKPVGTIWLALAGPTGVKTKKIILPFDRRRNKILAVEHALDLLRRELKG